MQLVVVLLLLASYPDFGAVMIPKNKNLIISKNMIKDYKIPTESGHSC